MRRKDVQQQVGEIAKATGLTVRALHHYEELGLLSPARDAVGHRRYSAADVRRLHQIIALRGFGLSLAEIATMLDGSGPDPRELVRRQLAQSEERLSAQRRLHQRLITLLDTLDQRAESSTVEFVDVIEEMLIMEKHFSPEQLEQMAQQRRELFERLSPEEVAEMQRTRKTAFDAMSPQEREKLQRSRAAYPE
jgi:DNA-binding transcriptional MerR regulator